MKETKKRITFRVHAIQRMFERAIDPEDVKGVLASGEEIERYEDDKPYPSRLVLGWSGRRPLHVVAADNAEDNETIVITVYEPAHDKWGKGFRRRRP